MNFSQKLKEFLSSEKSFAVVYSSLSASRIVTEKTSRLVVLDSSFNPPHLGHWSLAEEALKFNYSTNSDPQIAQGDAIDLDVPIEPSKNVVGDKNSASALLLLLSVKNADKANLTPAPFEHRLEMMYLMAQKWHQVTKGDVSIGITSHAKFVDKLVAILEQLPHPAKLTFAVGYDTLVRILDQKYYLPDRLLDSLCEFMNTSDIFCLTRADDPDSSVQQLQFVDDLGRGHFAHIPKSWALSIHILNVPGLKISLVSSSQMRRDYAEGKNSEKDSILAEVDNYIMKNKLYTV